jgi:hypothetical protein
MGVVKKLAKLSRVIRERALKIPVSFIIVCCWRAPCKSGALPAGEKLLRL